MSKWEEESSGSEEESLTDEQKEHKRKFREWRKKHYNEFHAVKRARELIKKVERDHLSPLLFTELDAGIIIHVIQSPMSCLSIGRTVRTFRIVSYIVSVCC